ncbi:MAG: hypothetical protein WCF79_06815 [Rhodomicrobium sp.]|jgi:hypothetical protein
MSDAYVIELQGNAVGIIVRRSHDDPAYRFMAALHGFNSLEGVEFSGPFQAEKAARKLWRERPYILRAAPEHIGFCD